MKVSKTTENNWKHHFPHYKSMGVFLRRSRAANSVVGGPIWPKFELIHNIMHVLVTSKFEKDRININGDYVMTLDSGARGRGFETYRRRVVSLSKTLYSPKVLVNYPGSGGSVPI